MARLAGHEEDDEGEEEESDGAANLMSCPVDGRTARSGDAYRRRRPRRRQQFLPFFGIVAAALRRSFVTCSVDPQEDLCVAMDIGWPTNVRHIAHVTFDRFQGFLGLPVEMEHDVLRRAPSASASVFGVSAKSMQCSFDNRGNSVPTILLLMQQHLYSQGGLLAEGIFRINAENSQELFVRDQLNKGAVPERVDLHCLAGLMKAWFRELPSGVLDSLTPDQVMHCNTEEECSQLVSILPTTEAALLDWAINLMADVVECEQYNKMNARNIAMVFAPNMTQMADPLTALIHAVQVMNFLKMLIMKTLQEREEAAAALLVLSSSSCSMSPSDKVAPNFSKQKVNSFGFSDRSVDVCLFENGSLDRKILNDRCGVESDDIESFWSFGKDSATAESLESTTEKSLPMYSGGKCTAERVKADHGSGVRNKLSIRDGVKRLCRHPVFLLGKSVKRRDQAIVNSAIQGREAWA